MTDELKEVAKKVDQDLVKHIENLLEDAKAGELQGIIYVSMTGPGGTNYGWCANGTHEINAVVGSLFNLMTALGNNSEGMFKDIKRLKELLGE